ncbi:PREDICTED: uncharacterized protein LOC102015457 [Chinchilla lanigera]|uniref:uncharacterized protein LOC102015457 n=1 Tax=Chinchilla lanigera TaxID=34839 RepID=UPI00038EEF45|nr:PREDICTED: uncharacterized protein LOC102015457 [Chinchilla lanigera]
MQNYRVHVCAPGSLSARQFSPITTCLAAPDSSDIIQKSKQIAVLRAFQEPSGGGSEGRGGGTEGHTSVGPAGVSQLGDSVGGPGLGGHRRTRCGALLDWWAAITNLRHLAQGDVGSVHLSLKPTRWTLRGARAPSWGADGKAAGIPGTKGRKARSLERHGQAGAAGGRGWGQRPHPGRAAVGWRRPHTARRGGNGWDSSLGAAGRAGTAQGALGTAAGTSPGSSRHSPQALEAPRSRETARGDHVEARGLSSQGPPLGPASGSGSSLAQACGEPGSWARKLEECMAYRKSTAKNWIMEPGRLTLSSSERDLDRRQNSVFCFRVWVSMLDYNKSLREEEAARRTRTQRAICQWQDRQRSKSDTPKYPLHAHCPEAPRECGGASAAHQGPES